MIISEEKTRDIFSISLVNIVAHFSTLTEKKRKDDLENVV